MSSMRVVALCVGTAIAVGCASRTGAPLTAASGAPRKPVALTRADSLGPSALRREMKRSRHLAVKPTMKESAGTRAETVDPQLAAALGLAASQPSAGHSLLIA